MASAQRDRSRSRNMKRAAFVTGGLTAGGSGGLAAVMSAKSCLEAIGQRLQVDFRTVASKLDGTVEEAWQQARAQGRRGVVDCGRIQRAKSDPKRPGFLAVGVSKQRGKIGQGLSPFFLDVPEALMLFATATGSNGGPLLPRRPLELVWQAAKVKKAEIGSDGLVTDAYIKRRNSIYATGNVQRRYIKREEIGGTLLSWRTLAPVNYLDSRKYYCLAYSQAVAATPAFRFLKELQEAGFSLLLLGPDGHPFFEGSALAELQKMPPEELQRSFQEAYRDTSRQFGHERVLVTMLLGLRPWDEYPDPTGGLLPDGGPPAALALD